MTGLIGWWPLNEVSGDTARDLSGNGNHGSLSGGVTQGVAGKSGLTSYSFDGSDDYVNAEISSVLSGIGTFSAWVRISDKASQSTIGEYFEDESNRHLFGYLDKDGNIEFFSESGGNANRILTTSVVEGKWYHLVVTYNFNENLYKLYLNSELKDSSTNNYSEPSISSPRLRFGVYQFDNSDNNYKGSINDVRVYNRVLTSKEIQDLYESGSGDYTTRSLSDGSDSGAVSRWKFDNDNNDSSVAEDFWGDNNGDVNGANFVDNSVRGKALSFNSSDGEYVGVGNDSSLNPDQITVSAWVNSGDVSRSGGIVTRWGNGSGWSYILRTYNGNFRYQMQDENDNAVIIENNATNNDYYHLAMTYDGTTVKAYQNSQLVGTSESLNTSLKTISNPTTVGNRHGNGSYDTPFDGVIDDVRIYNRALEPHEVFELYQRGTRGRDLRKQLVNKR